MKLNALNEGKGPQLIVLHGLFGMLDNWKSLGRRFAEHFDTHLLDLRNHGHSPHSEEWNYEVMADDVLEYMDENGISEATILGHSMGGKVAMCLAGRFPERVTRLIVVDISPRYYPVHHQRFLEAMNGLPLESIRSRKEAEGYLEKSIAEFGIRQFLLKNLYWKEKGQLEWRFNLQVITAQIENVGEGLGLDAHYDGPTLFIAGGNSDYIGVGDLSLIHEHFPNAQVEVIDGAGHWVHAEKPVELFELVVEA
jgi:pimeloyl-ACP methyl ester carboxylesterase